MINAEELKALDKMVELWRGGSMKDAIEKLDSLFFKYGIKDFKDILGYRNKFVDYVKSLEGINLEEEYKKQTLFYDFLELQKEIGIDKDLLNNYTMILTKANKKLGQDFTPDCILDVISKVLINNDISNPVFYDCAGGTGSQLIKAYYMWLNNKNFLDQFNSLLEVDEYDIYNCYCCVFNFIIRGLNAIVRNKNTLTGETYAVFIITNKYTYNKEISWFSDFKTVTNKNEVSIW